ncbi:TATA-binding protein-associated factor 2N [Tripterygium wilfordii]|uniref:TATA-binding protein-associated factor 2N n=1 Tax=Tripterygium wilfordii TaxID=458696 RepID=A0A7J7DAQ8_TRIWF|nr:uncharacterized protein LOC120004602 [Tripterygium wilfordii]KAF5743440.1 TATA-binding protein-associated factor 2N [Tripterygium wilfordii]
MGSWDRDQTTPHRPPLLSSLVIRPSASDGEGTGGVRAGGSDYEPGEVRHDLPLYSHSDRYSHDRGFRTRADSASPPRQRGGDHHYSTIFDNSGGPPRSREFAGRRDPGRYRDPSPPYMRGRGGGRMFGRGFERPGFGRGLLRREGMGRNNPNVRPREGDWICPDHLCNNLNFARRDSCNSCKRFRYAPGGSPRRGYPRPVPPFASHRRFPGLPMDLSPGRTNGYRSPPRRDFGPGDLPPDRYEGQFSDLSMRRDHLNYPEDEFRRRDNFERSVEMNWGHRVRGRENLYNERREFERQPHSPHVAAVAPPVSPPPPAVPRGRWARDMRERSRSPLRRAPPQKEYRRLYGE